MKNFFIKRIQGYVRLYVDAPFPEHFLNRCLEEGIEVWKIKKVGEKRISFYMDLENVHRIRPIAKKTESKVHFSSRFGLPFFLKRMLTRSGFVVGILLCLIMLFVGSNMVWGIEVKGASPQVETQLIKLIHEIGLKKGKFQFQLPPEEDIQTYVTEQLDGATWVGVKKKGTTYEFEVVEQTLPERAELLDPRHLVSTRKAIIHDIYVEHGQALVKPNDFVQKGDILISGYIGKEGNEQIVPAVGVVRGEIWYKSHVETSIESLFTNLTGEHKEKHYLQVFGLDIPIWGFGKTEYENFREFEDEKPFQFLKWELPLAYKKTTISETTPFQRTYSKEDAIEKAKEFSKKELMKRLPDNAEVHGEKLLHETLENGKVILEIHYEVIEDIMQVQPIIQGD
ncbi:sporulation protein YqfD [Alkalihalobacillus pseudalcaliphilus]|uniref:sporulation protein YqfD n=1 Tax=Alkalihalobacillus pseudalcaliphilus TaxID=79884 RepID=UPI00064D74FE|nr:sporulation protein YqfD [Alkalihalobacillus pseudalcaliphilus]KMK75954.1 stage IV sporulation protein [Alkalihalobacillus pseudalcaliphilus]